MIEKTASGRARTYTNDEPIIDMRKASKSLSYDELLKKEIRDLKKQYPFWPDHHIERQAKMYADIQVIE